MKRNLLTLIIGAVLVVIFGLLLFVFQVRKSDVAVVTTFGKLTRTAGPGPHLRWPWPVQKVHTLDQRIQSFEDKYTEDLTSDSINLLTQVYVGWRITDARAFFPVFPGGSTAAAERMLEGILISAKRSVVGRHALSDFVNPDPREIKFDTIEAEIEDLVQSQLQTNNCGIEVVFLGLKKIGLPQAVTQAVFARMTSERNVLSSRLQSEGQAEADKIRSAAKTKAAETLYNAEAQATRIRSEGEAEAAKILPVFQQDPELANFLLRVEALEQSLKERSTLIFDQHVPPFDLFQSIWTNLPAGQAVAPSH
jgi:membrane protease subunit HflC